MQKRLVHLLLVFLLLCAQTLAAVHGIEHAAAHDENLPPHVCELCLATHDLGNGVGSASFDLPPLAADYIFHLQHHTGRSTLPAPQARQQAPPLA